MAYWNWKKDLNQFNYDYDRTMAEISEQRAAAAAASNGADDDE